MVSSPTHFEIWGFFKKGIIRFVWVMKSLVRLARFSDRQLKPSGDWRSVLAWACGDRPRGFLLIWSEQLEVQILLWKLRWRWADFFCFSASLFSIINSTPFISIYLRNQIQKGECIIGFWSIWSWIRANSIDQMKQSNHIIALLLKLVWEKCILNLIILAVESSFVHIHCFQKLLSFWCSRLLVWHSSKQAFVMMFPDQQFYKTPSKRRQNSSDRHQKAYLTSLVI